MFSNEELRKHHLFNGPQIDPTAVAAREGFAYVSKRQRKGTPLMPDDFMPCGPFTGRHLRDVPAAHLAWVNGQPWALEWSDWAPVRDYLTRFPPAEKTVAEGAARVDMVDGGVSPEPPSTTVHHRQPPSTVPSAPAPVFYVDALRACERHAGWKFDHSAVLHCLPGDEDALHAFAAGALGLRRAWYVTTRAGEGRQRIPVMPHYLINPWKHSAALKHACVHLIEEAGLSKHMAAWGQFLQDEETRRLGDWESQKRRRSTPFSRLAKTGKWCPSTKRGYSKIEAETLRNERTQGRQDYRHNRPKTLRIYECPDCGMWHLTHKL